jgi:outer membrane protein assembly factor BamA
MAARGARSSCAWAALCAALCCWHGKVEAAEEVTPPGPPDFLSNALPMPEELLKNKREHTYITGYPITGYSPDAGVAFGAGLQWFNNGSKESSLFSYVPYRQRLAVGAAGSTLRTWSVGMNYNHLYIRDSPWSLHVDAGLHRQVATYFGRGESTLGPLTYPGSTLTYDDFSDYTDALNRDVNGTTWSHYNKYRDTRTGGLVAVERDAWGGWLRPQVGLEVGYIGVHDYTGDTFSGAVEQPTRLLSDQQAGKLTGFGGGWDNALRIGLAFDTRDYPPDPDRGVLAEVAARISTRIVGSAFDYQQFTFSVRGFHNLLGGGRRLILAGRLTYVMQFGDVPFYSASTIPGVQGPSSSETDVTGLGGFPTLRGYAQDRFVGNAAVFANGELRWSFVDLNLWKQNFRFSVVPFVDVGTIYDSVGNTNAQHLRIDGGLALRIAWNVATIASLEYATSGDAHFFYAAEGNQF